MWSWRKSTVTGLQIPECSQNHADFCKSARRTYRVQGIDIILCFILCKREEDTDKNQAGEVLQSMGLKEAQMWGLLRPMPEEQWCVVSQLQGSAVSACAVQHEGSEFVLQSHHVSMLHCSVFVWPMTPSDSISVTFRMLPIPPSEVTVSSACA